MAVQGDEPVESGYFAEVEDLFFDALELPPEQRDTWLQERCAGRQEIFTEVQTLLEAHLSSEAFLSESPDLKGIAACPDLSGRRLGNYQVVEEIARGGMGRVYSADRVDGEYEQRVAIKVVELGNVEADMFRRERQTLANLEHPNIVTLLDGGTLEEGFPYLVMELVEGQAIDLYNISHKLDRKTLVSLFCTLCNVVDQAHQQSVIHCDLKPANILVTENGILKLLDFGISQSLIKTHDEYTEEMGSQALTPEYSSPQRQQHLPPHITDDVYSLGVVLAQLLIGGDLPRVATELLVKKRYKQINHEQLLGLISSHELRMIVKKAISPIPEQRYASAKLMGEDLRNWLDEKPIDAISHGKFWHFHTVHKNISRNRQFWLIVLGIFVAVGAGAAYLDYQQKREVTKLNLQAAVSARRVSNDLTAVISRTQPSLAVQLELTELAINNIEKSLGEVPDNIPARFVLAESLTRYGKLKGHPNYLNEGDTTTAIDFLTQAEGHLEDLQELIKTVAPDMLLGDENDDKIDAAAIQLDLLRVRRLLAEIRIYTEPREQGLAKFAEVEAAFDAITYNSESRKRRTEYVNDLLYFAHANLLTKQFEQFERHLDHAEQLLNSLATVQRESEVELLKDVRFFRAFIKELRGHFWYLKGNPQRAVSYYQTIVDSQTDMRMTPLLNRVAEMRACLVLADGQADLAKRLRDDIRTRRGELAREHPDAQYLLQRKARIDSESLSLEQQLQCNNPEFILFPFEPLGPEAVQRVKENN